MIRLQHVALLLSAIGIASCGSPQDSDLPPDNMRTLPVQSITVTGILVDSFCYAQLRSGQPDSDRPVIDPACSSKSVESGYPMVVVTDRDNVWVLSESPRVFAKSLNDSVRVTGDIRSEGVLIPRTFDRWRNEAWESVF